MKTLLRSPIVSAVLLCLALSALPVPESVWAGTSTHGGSGVVCESPSEKRVALLDLFEAEVRGTQLIAQETSYLETLQYAKERAREAAPEAAYLHLALDSGVEAAIQALWFVGAVETIPDSGPIQPLPPNCQVKQIANYDYRTQIYIHEDLWRQLPTRDRAALILHEVLYSMQRSTSHEYDHHSNPTRELVALLLSTSTATPVLQEKITEFTRGFSAGHFVGRTYLGQDAPFTVDFGWDLSSRRATASWTLDPRAFCDPLQTVPAQSGSATLIFQLSTGRLITPDLEAWFQIQPDGSILASCGYTELRRAP